MREFKETILILRTEKGITQEELAKTLGIAKSTIAMWETGDRTPTKNAYEAIADLFNVDIDYLYGRSDVRQKVHFDMDGNEMRYINEETSKIANAIFENEDLRKLFDVSQDMTPEQIKAFTAMIDTMITKDKMSSKKD